MTAAPAAAVAPREHYLNVDYGIRSWLLTTDHKRIAVLYMISITVMFFIGGIFATLIRLELMTPAGDLVTSDTYNKLFTMHGIVMVFFFLIPSVPAVIGNFVLPMMVGARDMAFPKINLLSWYMYVIGAAITLYCIIVGGVDTGWTFYTPFSTTYSNTYVFGSIVGILFAGFSSIFTGLNFIATIHKLRAPGLTWRRMQLFLWSNYATAVIMILGTPVVAIVLILVAVERMWHIGIFNPALGGDPVLFQHLFWFYSHPAVYIMVLPAMGVVSELVSTFSRKRVFGYEFVAAASIAIAVFGFLVWGHHMFVAGISIYSALLFSVMSYLVAIPSAIKVFNWTATLYKGAISYRTPMLYAFGFIGLFTIGGLTGLFVAALGVDIHVTDTYFVVAHFHYIMVGGTVMAYLGRHSLLVAEDVRTDVSRGMGENFRGNYLHRLQRDVLSAVPAGIPRHAAALSRLCARVSGAQRHVHRRRFHSGGGIPAAAHLPDLVAALRRDCACESVGIDRPGVADHLSAAYAQLRGNSHRERRSLRLR